jgi:carbon monoxide dehydrogenase subunit G
VSEFSETVSINTSIAKVWATLADIGTISSWNPGVKESHQTTSGEVAKGACRHCGLGGKNYLEEEVVLYQPPTNITFRITATNLPFDAADIRFTLVSDGDATAVTVSPLYQLKYGVLGKILDALLVRPTYRKGMRDLLRGLKTHVEATAT